MMKRMEDKPERRKPRVQVLGGADGRPASPGPPTSSWAYPPVVPARHGCPCCRAVACARQGRRRAKRGGRAPQLGQVSWDKPAPGQDPHLLSPGRRTHGNPAKVNLFNGQAGLRQSDV